MTNQIQAGGSFAAIVEETNAIIEAAKKKAKDAFMAELRDVFQRHPEIVCFKWNQYTPYFNDGDTCEFSVNSVYFSNSLDINGWGELDNDDGEEPDGFFCHDIAWKRPREYADLDALASFIGSSTGEEILQFMFGDHVTVTITKDGAETEEFEHD